MANYYIAGIPYSSELYHFGIKGQKWGIRRYQNSDGTLTDVGKKRYYRKSDRLYRKADYYDSLANDAKSKIRESVRRERNAKQNIALYTNKKADLVQKIDRYDSSNSKLERFFIGNSRSLNKKLDRIIKSISNEEYNLNDAIAYKNKYQNMLEDVISSSNYYRTKGNIYKSLADKGITRRAARKQR